MGTEQRIRIDVERILHISCRVVLRNVGKLEVVVVLLNFRSFGNLVAHADEEVFNLLLNHDQRMNRSRLQPIAGQRDINLLFFKLCA